MDEVIPETNWPVVQAEIQRLLDFAAKTSNDESRSWALRKLDAFYAQYCLPQMVFIPSGVDVKPWR